MGSRDGVVVIPLTSIWPGFDPELVATCGLSWLMFVYSSPRGFSLGSPVFPSSHKPAFPNSNSIGCRTSSKTTFAWVEPLMWSPLIIVIVKMIVDERRGLRKTSRNRIANHQPNIQDRVEPRIQWWNVSTRTTPLALLPYFLVVHASIFLLSLNVFSIPVAHCCWLC